MNKQNKIAIIKAAMKGGSDWKNLLPPEFIEVKECEGEPGIFVTKENERLTGEELESRINAASKKAGIVWAEIKTY